jgi:hypothetical protein
MAAKGDNAARPERAILAADDEPSEYPARPGALQGLLVILGVALGIWVLARRGDDGIDDQIGKVGRIEVTARLLDRPDQFPQLGAYRYTYVLKYEVLQVHRPDPEKKHQLTPGAEIFVGHYQPWLPRSQIKDADWGKEPLGGKLDQFRAGDAHRLALDYELQDLAPSGALDYCYPPNTNRFFAIWTNPTR